MAKLLRLTLALLVFSLANISLSQVQAAPSGDPANPVTVNIEVKVDNPANFWDLTYLTKDSILSKATTIKVSWDAKSDKGKTSGSEIAVTKGQTAGKVAIRTVKGSLVNYQVTVIGTNNTVLATLSMNVRDSKNQTKTVTISPPETIFPNINYGNTTSSYSQYTSS
ncbi:MAG: hypothetical protein H6Q73_2848 [Firmicutes bacterium]|nr:hypothetical protein [Bacillota bacterium]